MLIRNEKMIKQYIYSCQVIYSVSYNLRVRTHEAKWSQTGMRFHFGRKSNLGVQSALCLCSVELRRNEISNQHEISCEQNLTKTKWISADSLNIAFSAHVRLKFISGDEIRKHYPKWNSYTCPSKYRIVFALVWNLKWVRVYFASCESTLRSVDMR